MRSILKTLIMTIILGGVIIWLVASAGLFGIPRRYALPWGGSFELPWTSSLPLPWTENRKAADPVGYLQHELGNLGAKHELARKALDTYQKGVAQLDLARRRAEEKLLEAYRDFAGARSVYLGAEASAAWPAMFQGTPFYQDNLKKKILSLNSNVDTFEVHQRKYADAQAQASIILDQRSSELEGHALTIALLQQQVEVASLHQNHDELLRLSEDMRAVAESLNGLVQGEMPPTVEVLINSHVPGERNFDDVMSRPVPQSVRSSNSTGPEERGTARVLQEKPGALSTGTDKETISVPVVTNSVTNNGTQGNGCVEIHPVLREAPEALLATPSAASLSGHRQTIPRRTPVPKTEEELNRRLRRTPGS
jgi:hypothetical protein